MQGLDLPIPYTLTWGTQLGEVCSFKHILAPFEDPGDNQ